MHRIFFGQARDDVPKYRLALVVVGESTQCTSD
jgi:hypothetical protein